jgi:hypothetical protein
MNTIPHSFRIEKKVGNYTIVWMGPITDKGRTIAPQGQPGRPGDPADTTPKNQEHDFDQLYYVAKTWIEKDASVISPIITDFAFVNKGYILTFTCVFWSEGFVINDGIPGFVSIGETFSMGCNNGLFSSLQSIPVSLCGVEISRDQLLAAFKDFDSTKDWSDELKSQLLSDCFSSLMSIQRDGAISDYESDRFVWDQGTQKISLLSK